MRVLSFPAAHTPAPLGAQVQELHEQAWPSAGGSPAAAHDPVLRPLSLLLVEHDLVLASLDVLFADLVHAGQRWAVGGLSTVVTRRSVRGRGHGGRLVAAAREAMIGMSLDLSLFTCDRPLQAFYERAGWRVLPGAVLVGGTPTAPFPSDRAGFDKVVLAEFFAPAARAARASFEHARIELYPGEIDKLW